MFDPRMPPSAVPAVPPASIAAMVRALPASTQPTAAFRDAACAALRLTRARGRMECDALAVVFEDEQTTDERRTLILDLLASAGTPEAQIVMRRLLALGVARRDSRTFASFVQRLGFMERPDGATLRFLISVYAQSKHEVHEVRAACAYALGAGAGRAHVWGLSDAAMRAAEVLRFDLLHATSPTEKCALVTALGNAGLESDVGVILRFVEDEDGRVRGAAALALKKMHTPEARAALLALLVTNDENVAESALSALFEQSLVQEEIVRLAELVLAGRTPLALDSRILRLIVTQKLNVVGQISADTVEDAIHLLLSRIEAKALHGAGAAASQNVPSPASAWVRSAAASEPRTSAHRSRMVPMPKTPLPYSAGYRVVGEETWDAVPDTVDDARLAAMSEELARAEANAAAQATEPLASPAPRRAITPAAQRTLLHGSLSDALEAVRNATAPRSEVRTTSEVTVASPIVPLAIIR